MATPTWVGNKADLRKESLMALNRGVFEYMQVYEGKADDVTWPALVIGAGISPTVGGISPSGLLWYDIQCENPIRGPMAQYIAKASNKFDDNKSEWSASSTQTLIGALYVALPNVTKVSYHITPPTCGAVIILETPVPPFTLPTLTAPYALPYMFTPYHWVKTSDGVALQNQIWTHSQVWAIQYFVT